MTQDSSGATLCKDSDSMLLISAVRNSVIGKPNTDNKGIKMTALLYIFFPSLTREVLQ